MNRSNRSRQDQVLDYLAERVGSWVDGPDLANERVGGSEGHRRLRELRAEGWPIERRRHPDPERSIWQYRLVPRQAPAVAPGQAPLWPDA